MERNMPCLKVALAQIAPVWLDKAKTLEKIYAAIQEAAGKSCDLVVFGEALLPGYPFWLALTNGAAWNDSIQKEIFAHYARNAIQIEAAELDKVCLMAKQNKIAIYLGIIERAANRGGHSLYCSLVYIDSQGIIQSVHRKLQPTYDERLVWAQGDGNGLQVHTLGKFTVGGLNCWENWMPLARTALYGLGENLHIAVWPGSIRNTEDITKFIAKEGRSYVVSVSALMSKKDFLNSDVPHIEKIIADAPEILTDGGSCVAAPNGDWVLEPVLHTEAVFIVELDFEKVLQERQNFDAVGHYSRPDVTQLKVNRQRQSLVYFE